MKLTDLSILFVAVFICLILPLELRIKDDREKYYTDIQYNRVWDRISEDVTEDVVITEDWEGEPVVDREAVNEKLDKLIKLAFDIDGEACLSKGYDWFLMRDFYAFGKNITYDESEEIRRLMEDEINMAQYEKRIKNYRRDAEFYTMTFPYSKGESRYQNVFGPTFLAVFDPDDDNMPWAGFDRVVISGSRIEKTKGSRYTQ